MKHRAVSTQSSASSLSHGAGGLCRAGVLLTQMATSSGLSKQDLATLNVAELNALSPEVISRQATINIGAQELRASPACAGAPARHHCNAPLNWPWHERELPASRGESKDVPVAHTYKCPGTRSHRPALLTQGQSATSPTASLLSSRPSLVSMCAIPGCARSSAMRAYLGHTASLRRWPHLAPPTLH